MCAGHKREKARGAAKREKAAFRQKRHRATVRGLSSSAQALENWALGSAEAIRRRLVKSLVSDAISNVAQGLAEEAAARRRAEAAERERLRRREVTPVKAEPRSLPRRSASSGTITPPVRTMSRREFGKIRRFMLSDMLATLKRVAQF